MHLIRLLLLLAASSTASAATLQPFAGAGSEPAAPWRVVGLPNQTKPLTRFSIESLDGHRALRVEAESSYGNLVHPLSLVQPPHHLAWEWRVEDPIPAADIQTRQGEDIAMKVCALWDLPLDRVPFFDRQVLRIARSRSGEPLPAATVCYIWDPHLAPGTELRSPYTGRVRYVVLRGPADPLHHWAHERRDIAEDFHRLFGAESSELPPLIGIAVGADADNTKSHSLGHAADVQLEP